MRPEKKYLVDEVGSHLDKSDYVFLTNYERITVKETEILRTSLAAENAEFHVIKNSVFNVAAKERDYPDLSESLDGPTAIIIGGNNPSGVAKVLVKFFKDTEKVDLKSGVVSDRVLTKDEIEQLSKLPGLDELRAQLLSLLNTPATQLVRVLNAPQQDLVNVLEAKRRKDAGE